jgi:hypothetical protein
MIRAAAERMRITRPALAIAPIVKTTKIVVAAVVGVIDSGKNSCSTVSLNMLLLNGRHSPA